MSLYRGYFDLNRVDPYGLECVEMRRDYKILSPDSKPKQIGVLLGVPIFFEFRSELYVSGGMRHCTVCCDPKKGELGEEISFFAEVKYKLFGAVTWGIADDREMFGGHVRYWAGLRAEFGDEGKFRFSVTSECKKKTCFEAKAELNATLAGRIGGEATWAYKSNHRDKYNWFSWTLAVSGNLEGRCGFSMKAKICTDGTIETQGIEFHGCSGRAYIKFCMGGCIEYGYTF